jgi:iron complex outermembrane receptor protein
VFKLLLFPAAVCSVVFVCSSGVSYGQSAASAAAATSGDVALEEITVTATRRSENVQEVPVAVTALSAAALSASGVTDIRDLTVAVPDFNGGRNFVGFQPVIRGVGYSGTSVGDESNVALYIDGVYQPSSHSNNIDLVEVDRVEVLRGPQGTLFGRNATGGLINVITPDPSFTATGETSVSYGEMKSTGDVQARGYITGPLADNLAADFAVLYRDNGSYIRNLVAGGDLGQARVLDFRSKVLFRPTDKISFTLAVAHNDSDDTAGNDVQPWRGNSIANSQPSTIVATSAYQSALSLPPFTDYSDWNTYLKANVDFGSVAFESTSSYLSDDINQQSDNDATPIVGGQSRLSIDDKIFSQELRLISQASGPLQWTAGTYIFVAKGTGDANVTSGIPPAYVATVQTHLQPTSHTNAYSGFAEGTYSLTEHLKLTAGGRYSTELRKFSQVLNSHSLIDDAEVRYNDWTYRSILQYEFNPRANVYVSYSTGFKSGIFNTFGTSAAPVKPETVGSVEIGVKTLPLSWLRTNFAAFQYNYDDLQVTGRVPNSPLYLLLNAAKAGIQGLELENEAVLSPDFTLRFNGSLLYARFTSFPNAQVFVPSGAGGNIAITEDVTGNNLLRAPRYTLSLSGNWNHRFAAGQMDASGSIFRSATVYYDFANRLNQPAYYQANADLGWSPGSGNARFGLYCRNLTGAVVAQQISSVSYADYITYAPPREIGLNVRYKY